MSAQPHIHCPLCSWEPKIDSRWYCTPGEPGSGCGTRWHTFWTAGCCPGCGHFWEKTQCFSCKQSSPHQSWYHYPEGNSDWTERERSVETVV